MGCGKKTFAQKSALNNLFGKNQTVEWISKIELSANREAQIESCFSAKVSFHYPNNIPESEKVLSSL